jgi:hypothetical protein
MKDSKYSNLKLFLNTISIILLGFGWYYQEMTAAIGGAMFHILNILVGLLFMILKSKQFQKDNSVEMPNTLTDKISYIIECVLVFTSLIVLGSKNELFLLPGQIIWGGQMIMFALIGPILENFAGIPMRMTYGGWRVGRHRKTRKH